MKKSFPQWLTSHKLKNLSKKALLSAGLFMMISIAANSQTNYYLRLDSVKAGKAVKPTPSSLKFWTTDPLGTITAAGATQPVNFTDPNQIFNIQTTGYTNGAIWPTTGAISKLVVGTKDSIVTFTTSGNLTATVDVYAGSSLILSCASTDGITLGSLGVKSTIRYSGNATASQKVIPFNYENFTINVAAGSLPVVLPSSPIGVAGAFSNNGKVANLDGSTFNINGAGGQLINGGLFYNINFIGAKSAPDTLRGAIGVAGALTNTSGTPLVVATANATTGVMAYSTVNYNGLIPQVASLPTYGTLNYTNGQSFYVSSFDNTAKTITLAASAPSDLVVGSKIASNVLTNTINLDTSTVITAITDSVLTLSNAPLLRAYVNHANHPTGAKPDSVFISSYALNGDSTITLSAVDTSLHLGDTIVSQILTAKSVVVAIDATNSALLTLSLGSKTKALVNLHNLLTVNLGNANKLPTAKTIPSDVTILGNFTAGGAVTSTAAGTTSYKGKKQTVGGIVYNNLVINQDSAFTATLNGPALVQGTFTLQSGKLATTAANVLTLDANATFPTVANDTFFVSGPLAKKFNSATPFTYQIGAITSNISRPRKVTITPATADAKTYTATFATGKANAYTATRVDTSFLAAVDTLSYYNVVLSKYTPGADTSAMLSFQYGSDSVITSNSLALAHYFHNKFVSEGAGLQAVAGPNTTFGSITTSGYDTVFGRYAFAFIRPELQPVTFATVSASAIGSSVKVSWQSQTEVNVASYVVEGSADGVTFSDKGTVAAKGASVYSFVDVTPSTGVNYYRIKEVDNNGSTTYSAVVSVKGSNSAASLAIYPNPVSDKQLKFVLNTEAANYTLKVTNILGQTVLAKTIAHNGGSTSYNVSLPSIKAGTYFVKLSNGANQLTKTVIVE